MVKRVISDPIELFSRQVQDILNKITPQTFGKLTEKLKDIPINTYTFLELLISKVFEKAVQEPNFANLYADMCVALEEKSACWGFVQVVYVKDANQHIWVKDIPMDNDTYAGPFATVKESLQAGEHINTIQLTLAPGPLEIHKIVAVGNSLITVSHFV
jgi:translation initiation factor 4G